MKIPKSALDFVVKLKKNNDRDWFNKHKEEYIKNHQFIIEVADAVLTELKKHDKIETVSGKKSLHRIYRDVRFSKDKTPYNCHWAGSFKRATKLLRGGFYFHIEQGNSFVGGGFWGPSSPDLKRIRQDIAFNHNDLREIINSEEFKTTFGELRGEQVKTAPKGFDKDHEAIDLLRYKQFLIKKDFSDTEVLKQDFHLQIVDTFVKMLPFFEYMSTALTTDANGELLHELINE